MGQRTLILRITSLSGSVIFSSSLFVGRIRGKKTKNKKQKTKFIRLMACSLSMLHPEYQKLSVLILFAPQASPIFHTSQIISLYPWTRHGVVCSWIRENQAHISDESLRVAIQVVFQSAINGAEIHRFGHYLGVVLTQKVNINGFKLGWYCLGLNEKPGLI